MDKHERKLGDESPKIRHPLIGLRGRYNLSKAFYLTAETDVGGFGIGSDIAVDAYAALGCQITRNIFSAVGSPVSL